METTSTSMWNGVRGSHCMPGSASRQSSEPDAWSYRKDMFHSGNVSDNLGAFIEAVHPFHRTVYLVALAHTNDAGEAEFIAVQTMATAFRTWQGSRIPGELRLWLVGIALSEANAHVHKNEDARIDDSTEVLPNGFPLEGITQWRAAAMSAHDVAFRRALREAIRELPTNNRLPLFLRDVLHFTTLETASLLGVPQDTIRHRVAYGRIALCMKLAKHDSSGCDRSTRTLRHTIGQ
jgi:RNA polymerase sigma-70 factor (ECF subfamily)